VAIEEIVKFGRKEGIIQGEWGARFMVHLGGGLPNAKTLAELEAASC
jgi:hypothetical protein